MNKSESCSRGLKWTAALLLAAVAAGCGGGGQDPILGANVINPSLTPAVTLTTPIALNATGVCLQSIVSATFSKAMNPQTIVSATPGAVRTFTLMDITGGGSVDVPGTVAMNAGNTLATFTPSSPLAASSDYRATITTAAKDVANNSLANDLTWTFNTGTVPCAAPAASGFFTGGLLDPFAIASAGGITNAGPTKINGDVVLAPNQNCNGVAVGAGNNFGGCGGNVANVPLNNPGDLVITQIHPDTTTADAVMAELRAKWNSLSPALTPGATVLGCGTIGSLGDAGALIGCNGNSTLAPGTYISATGTTIGVGGILTLDAGNDPNAVWVFQAPSAVTTAVNSQIRLTNGAKASNIFWYVGSSATLNGGTKFQGNILASASISMGTLSTSCGRLLAGAEGAGQFTFLSNTVSVPNHAFAPQLPEACQ